MVENGGKCGHNLVTLRSKKCAKNVFSLPFYRNTKTAKKAGFAGVLLVGGGSFELPTPAV
jgi:hypothetical protein